ncbi:hypothetical protein [Falsiruegeria mediterranea]
MTDLTVAKARLVELIGIAAKAYDRENDGPLSIADFDEIELLTELLGDSLPTKVHSLVNSGFIRRSDGQREFGKRIERILSVSESFKSTQKAQNKSPGLLPVFNLEETDKKRILKLCTDMRKIIFSSAIFDEPHKKRLLNRVAAIEQQVHSKEGLFDVILGGVSDVGETLGKFGTDVKPLTDRMKEVMQIARKGTKEYNQIPAPEEVKRLPAPDETEDTDIE